MDPTSHVGSQSSRNPLFIGVLPSKERFPEKYLGVICGVPSVLHPGGCVLAFDKKSPPIFALYWDKKPQLSFEVCEIKVMGFEFWNDCKKLSLLSLNCREEQHFGTLFWFYAIRLRVIMVELLEECIWVLQLWGFFRFLMMKIVSEIIDEEKG